MVTDFKNKNLLVIGDSIINGSGNNNFGVGEYLNKSMGFTVHKYCVGGARTGYYEGKSWIVEQVLSAIAAGEKPDLIIFNAGTNDCHIALGSDKCDVPLGNAEDEGKDIYKVERTDNFTVCFKSVIGAFKKYFCGVKVIYIRCHKMGKRDAYFQKLYGERAAQICKEQGVPVADVYNESCLDTFDADMQKKYTNDSYGWGTGDCTHPNAAGYEKYYMPVIERVIRGL